MKKDNEEEPLIMQFNKNFNDWEDVTARIQWYEEEKNSCRVKCFSNDSFYHISWREIAVCKNPKKIDVSGKIIYHLENNLTDITLALKF